MIERIDLHEIYALIGGKSNIAKVYDKENAMYFYLKDAGIVNLQKLHEMSDFGSVELNGSRLVVSEKGENDMGKYQKLSEDILENVGGKDNISAVTHCVTRLRLTLKNNDLVNKEAINKLEGVLGSQFNAGQYQVIIGQQIPEVAADFAKVSGLSLGEIVDENLDGADTKKKLTLKDIPNAVLNTISAIVFPVIPIYLGAGLILLLINLLGPTIFNIIPADSNFAVFMNMVGQTGYYFMPIFIAWSAAKHFKTSIPMAMFLCAVMIYPDFVQLVADGGSMTIYGIPVTMVNYARQILPTILTVWILSYVYKFIDGHMPNSLKYAFNPLTTLLVMLPIEFCLLGPVGTFVGDLIAAVCVGISKAVGPLAIGVIGGLWYILVGLGMDKALVPVVVNNFTLYGYDNLFWLSAISATYALMGVGLAYIVRCKKEEKSGAASAFVTLAVGGVSEPTIFVTLFRYKKSMIAYMAGGFVGGLLSGIFGLKAFTIGTGNALFFTVCAAEGVSLFPAIISCVAALAVSFGLALVLGFNDEKK